MPEQETELERDIAELLRQSEGLSYEERARLIVALIKKPTFIPDRGFDAPA